MRFSQEDIQTFRFQIVFFLLLNYILVTRNYAFTARYTEQVYDSLSECVSYIKFLKKEIISFAFDSTYTS